MYFPKSSTVNNLYSNGELVNVQTREIYTGYYYETYNEKYFAGRDPNDLKTQIELEFIPKEDGGGGFLPPPTTDLRFSTRNNINYSNLKGEPIQLEQLQPFPNFLPLPTPQDYQIGEFQRYFAKKINEEKYTEISLTTFNELKAQDPKYFFSQYIQFSLPWKLTGEKEQVARTNKNIIELTERQNNVFFLGRFLKFNYLQFYKN
jgi:hypothetical protein